MVSRAWDWVNRAANGEPFPYDNDRISSSLKYDVDGQHRYGADCSGFVSMAWHLPAGTTGGPNTSGLVGYTDETGNLSWSDLRAGDILLIPSAHTLMFDASSSDHVHFSYFTFGSSPPSHRTSSIDASTIDGHPTGDYLRRRYDKVLEGSPGGGVAEPALVRDNGDNSMHIYRWISDGDQFQRIADYTSGSFALSRVGNRVASGDVDGDGDDDIVMAYQNGDGTFSFHVFKSGISWAGVWYTSGQFSLAPVEDRLVVDDFTGDGKAEPALVRNDGDGTMTIWRWTSDGTGFDRTTDYTSGSFSLANVDGRVVSGDVNGDGRADIVMAYQNGDGTFGYHVFASGSSWAGIWYTSGPFSMGPVANRFVVGTW